MRGARATRLMNVNAGATRRWLNMAQPSALSHRRSPRKAAVRFPASHRVRGRYTVASFLGADVAPLPIRLMASKDGGRPSGLGRVPRDPSCRWEISIVTGFAVAAESSSNDVRNESSHFQAVTNARYLRKPQLCRWLWSTMLQPVTMSRKLRSPQKGGIASALLPTPPIPSCLTPAHIKTTCDGAASLERIHVQNLRALRAFRGGS
ncbi:hypothetical protein GY45DRAFT_1318819 [Cubamyces sp. BRFM 1775]|nr:hypothetical protein GY45DRAFT_1318819 [Cubamyces sp. BRFM 1775]